MTVRRKNARGCYWRARASNKVQVFVCPSSGSQAKPVTKHSRPTAPTQSETSFKGMRPVMRVCIDLQSHCRLRSKTETDGDSKQKWVPSITTSTKGSPPSYPVAQNHIGQKTCFFLEAKLMPLLICRQERTKTALLLCVVTRSLRENLPESKRRVH